MTNPEPAVFVRITLQCAPPSVLLNTAAQPGAQFGSKLAYSVLPSVGSTASALAFDAVRPVLIALQVPPPSVLLNTPLPAVPAYTVPGCNASSVTTGMSA